MSSAVVRVAQLTDTHFLEDGAEPEGGFAYDTGAAFDAVHAYMATQETPDLTVVTGDIADHGRPEQYRRAAEAFDKIASPVNVCPGNHDQDVAFTAGLGRPSVGTSRVIEAGSWCFLFADSNAGVMVPDGAGRYLDPAEYNDRLHGNGSLGARETSWIRDMCATSSAEHIFIWLHHPPDAPVGLTKDEAYAQEWRNLIADLPTVRGLGAGHTHIPDTYQFEGRPVFVGPSFKNNFDLEAQTMLPPGYRTYEFGEDGTVTSELHLVDDPRWPRYPIGRAVTSLLKGELSFEQFDEIVARKRETS